MKILLDECVPRRFRSALRGHDCQTVPEAGFAGEKNGRLLRLAEEAGFEVFLTIDRGIAYQQNLNSRRMSVLIIVTRSNRLADLLPHAEECQIALAALTPGGLVRVGERTG
jgi:hypothetical protein